MKVGIKPRLFGRLQVVLQIEICITVIETAVIKVWEL